MSGPLAGIRVVDFSTYMAVPLATMLLAEQGADVIKVEPPSGDPIRNDDRMTSRRNISAMFINTNRLKRSVVIDLKQSAGTRVAQRLIQHADVVLQNFRPGVAERLGIGYEQVCEVNKSIIYVTNTAWGKRGPFAGNKAYDGIVQAYSGLSSVQGKGRETGPESARTLVADKVSPVLLSNAILSALVAKERSGKGQRVDTSMLHSMIWWLWPDMFESQTFLEREGVQTGIDAAANMKTIFSTSDGYIAVMFGSEKEWKAFCYAAERPDLAEIDFDSASPETYRLMSDILEERSTDEWTSRLASAEVAFAPVLEPAQVVTDAQVLAIEAITEIDDPVVGKLRVPRPYANFSRTPARTGPAPNLGQHTWEVLLEVGFSRQEISALEVGRIVYSPSRSSV